MSTLEETETMTDRIKARDIATLSVNNVDRFKYHTDVLRDIFGKNLKAHMRATYKLDEDWRVWFPKLYKNNDFINELLNNGKIIEMNQLSESTLDGYKKFPKDEPGRRIVFAHITDDVTGEKYYKFVGVFSELVGDIHHAHCTRIATDIYYDKKGRFSIKPLT